MEETDLVEVATKKPRSLSIRAGDKAVIKQRAALHQLFAKDEEYSALDEYLVLSPDVTENIDDDVGSETSIKSTKNVMQLVYLDIQGYSAELIAKQLGIDKKDVLSIRRSDAYNNAKTHVTSEIVKHARGIMEVASLQAVKTLTDCLTSTNDKIRLRASSEILDRIGLTATQKIEVTATSNTMESLTDEQLAEILKTNHAIEATAEVITDVNTINKE